MLRDVQDCHQVSVESQASVHSLYTVPCPLFVVGIPMTILGIVTKHVHETGMVHQVAGDVLHVN